MAWGKKKSSRSVGMEQVEAQTSEESPLTEGPQTPERNSAVLSGSDSWYMTTPEFDGFIYSVGALACCAGTAIYSSPIYDPNLMSEFRRSMWYTVTNFSMVSQILYIVPGYFMQQFGALVVFRVSLAVMVLAYVIGGCWEKKASFMPDFMVITLTSIVGLTAAGITLSTMQLAGDNLATNSVSKGRVYGSLMVARYSSMITYAAMTTVIFNGKETELLFGSGLGWFGRLPFAFLALLLSFGVSSSMPPPGSGSGSIGAAAGDTLHVPWWPALLILLLASIGGHDLLSTWYNMEYYPEYLSTNWESYTLYFQFVLLGVLLLTIAVKQCGNTRLGGPEGNTRFVHTRTLSWNYSPLQAVRTVNVRFQDAIRSPQFRAMFVTVFVVCGAGMITFIDAFKITRAWSAEDARFWKNHNESWAPVLVSGILLGCAATAGLHEYMIVRGARSRAGGVVSWVGSWVMGLGFLLLVVMGHVHELNDDDDVTDDGSTDDGSGRGTTLSRILRPTTTDGDHIAPTMAPTAMPAVTGSMLTFLAGYLLVGLGFGMITTLVPILVDESFGVSSFGTVVGAVMCGGILGHLFFVNGLAYYFIESCGGENSEACFMPTFYVCTVTCLLVGPLQAYAAQFHAHPGAK